MPRCWRSAWKPPPITGWPRPISRSATSRCLRADRRARFAAGLEAAAGEGFQPQDQSGAGSRRLRSAATMRGPNIRACSRRSPAPTRRARTRWSPIFYRSPASMPSAAVRSPRSPTLLEQSALPPRAERHAACVLPSTRPSPRGAASVRARVRRGTLPLPRRAPQLEVTDQGRDWTERLRSIATAAPTITIPASSKPWPSHQPRSM